MYISQHNFKLNYYMKNLFLTLFVFTFGICQFSQAQFLKNEEAHKLKKSKVIIGLTSDSTLNQALLEAVGIAWTLTPIHDTLPLKDALEKQKKEGGITVIQLGVDVTSRTTTQGRMEIKTKSAGGYIGLNTKGGKQADLIQHLSYNSPAQFVFGLASLQDAVNTIIDENLSGMMKVQGAYGARKSKLKGKTLYICKDFVSDGITLNDIKSAYQGNVELLDVDDFEKVILEKENNGVYLNFVSVPVGDTYGFVAYIMGCDDHKTYNLFRNGKSNSLTKSTLKDLGS